MAAGIRLEILYEIRVAHLVTGLYKVVKLPHDMK